MDRYRMIDLPSYTSKQQDLMNEAYDKLRDLKHRLELNEERACKIDDLSWSDYPKAEQLWSKLSDYCEQLEQEIWTLKLAIENDDFWIIKEVLGV